MDPPEDPKNKLIRDLKRKNYLLRQRVRNEHKRAMMWFERYNSVYKDALKTEVDRLWAEMMNKRVAKP